MTTVEIIEWHRRAAKVMGLPPEAGFIPFADAEDCAYLLSRAEQAGFSVSECGFDSKYENVYRIVLSKQEKHYHTESDHVDPMVACRVAVTMACVLALEDLTR